MKSTILWIFNEKMKFYQIYLSKAVSVRWDEVKATMDSAVHDALAVQTAFGVEKSRKL